MKNGNKDINFTNFQDLNLNSFTNNYKPILDVFEESDEEKKNYSVGWDDDFISLKRVNESTEIENSIDHLDHYYTDSLGFDEEDSEDLPFLSTSSVLDSVRSLGTFPNQKRKQLKDIETDTSMSLEISDLNSPSLTDYEYLNFQRKKEIKKNKKILNKKKNKNRTIIHSDSNSFSLRDSKTEIKSSHISKIGKTNTWFNNNSNSHTKIVPNNFPKRNPNKQLDFNLNNNSKGNNSNTNQKQGVSIVQLQNYFLDFDLDLLKKVIEKGQLSELLSKEKEKQEKEKNEKTEKVEEREKERERVIKIEKTNGLGEIPNFTRNRKNNEGKNNKKKKKNKHRNNKHRNKKSQGLMKQKKKVYTEKINFNKFQEELEPSEVLEIYIKDKSDRKKAQLPNFSSSLKVENKPEIIDLKGMSKINSGDNDNGNGNGNYNYNFDTSQSIVLNKSKFSQAINKKKSQKFEKRKRNRPASSSSSPSTSDSEPNNNTNQSSGRLVYYKNKTETGINPNNDNDNLNHNHNHNNDNSDNYIDSNFHSNYVSPSITNSISRSNLRMRNSTRQPKTKPPKKNKRKKTRKMSSNEIDWQRKTWRFVFGRKKGVKILKKKRKKRQQRLNTPKHAKSIFEKWFLEHLDDPQGPYMDKETRTQLSQITSIPELQVQRWFGQRRRSQRLRWLKGEAPKPNWI
ncbi:homeobox protein meis1 [Anaeramoeba flamelloides]|uniref:Homeobox protein meis1 n=1 Tax=Anaeramoeba flamelloides TaxID=1746091 RepID=A0AAV7Z801_9EUKA|nr:homeobox protein meis1 [Anaeramoeba flamelloides]